MFFPARGYGVTGVAASGARQVPRPHSRRGLRPFRASCIRISPVPAGRRPPPSARACCRRIICLFAAASGSLPFGRRPRARARIRAFGGRGSRARLLAPLRSRRRACRSRGGSVRACGARHEQISPLTTIHCGQLTVFGYIYITFMHIFCYDPLSKSITFSISLDRVSDKKYSKRERRSK